MNDKKKKEVRVSTRTLAALTIASLILTIVFTEDMELIFAGMFFGCLLLVISLLANKIRVHIDESHSNSSHIDLPRIDSPKG